jgi:hypothetical protein
MNETWKRLKRLYKKRRFNYWNSINKSRSWKDKINDERKGLE